MMKLIAGKETRAYELLNLLKEECEDKFKYEAPIDVVQIAYCLQVKLRTTNKLDDVIGEIEIKNGEPIITINSLQNLMDERKRFTIAHELGHLCLHLAKEGNKTDGSFVDTKETMHRNNMWNFYEFQANNFAAQLLMPKDLMTKVANEFISTKKKEDPNMQREDFIEKYGDEFLEYMAKKFCVSKTAMRFRLKKLFNLNIS